MLLAHGAVDRAPHDLRDRSTAAPGPRGPHPRAVPRRARRCRCSSQALERPGARGARRRDPRAGPARRARPPRRPCSPPSGADRAVPAGPAADALRGHGRRHRRLAARRAVGDQPHDAARSRHTSAVRAASPRSLDELRVAARRRRRPAPSARRRRSRSAGWAAPRTSPRSCARRRADQPTGAAPGLRGRPGRARRARRPWTGSDGAARRPRPAAGRDRRHVAAAARARPGARALRRCAASNPSVETRSAPWRGCRASCGVSWDGFVDGLRGRAWSWLMDIRRCRSSSTSPSSTPPTSLLIVLAGLDFRAQHRRREAVVETFGGALTPGVSLLVPGLQRGGRHRHVGAGPARRCATRGTRWSSSTTAAPTRPSSGCARRSTSCPIPREIPQDVPDPRRGSSTCTCRATAGPGSSWCARRTPAGPRPSTSASTPPPSRSSR